MFYATPFATYSEHVRGFNISLRLKQRAQGQNNRFAHDPPPPSDFRISQSQDPHAVRVTMHFESVLAVNGHHFVTVVRPRMMDEIRQGGGACIAPRICFPQNTHGRTHTSIRNASRLRLHGFLCLWGGSLRPTVG